MHGIDRKLERMWKLLKSNQSSSSSSSTEKSSISSTSQSPPSSTVANTFFDDGGNEIFLFLYSIKFSIYKFFQTPATGLGDGAALFSTYFCWKTFSCDLIQARLSLVIMIFYSNSTNCAFVTCINKNVYRIHLISSIVS